MQGIGNDKALKILQKVGQTFSIPTMTDIHETTDADMVAPYVDVLQIPAFLVRQTDLVVAAARWRLRTVCYLVTTHMSLSQAKTYWFGAPLVVWDHTRSN